MRKYFEFIYRRHDYLIQDYIELYITNKCTLKCKSCGLLVPDAFPKKDYDIENLKRTVERYFEYVDYVKVFRVMGGETFLYEDLKELTLFFGENYMNRIGHLIFVTNGTILPPIDILKLISHYDIEIVLSDYSADIAQKRRAALLDLFHQTNVKYLIKNDDHWIDEFGDPRKVKHTDENVLRNLFQLCFNRCRTLENDKMYFCSIDSAAKRVGIIADSIGDYVDLNDNSDRDKKREEILNFDAGDVPKGYVSFCQNCYGGPNCNDRRIPFGEQLK